MVLRGCCYSAEWLVKVSRCSDYMSWGSGIRIHVLCPRLMSCVSSPRLAPEDPSFSPQGAVACTARECFRQFTQAGPCPITAQDTCYNLVAQLTGRAVFLVLRMYANFRQGKGVKSPWWDDYLLCGAFLRLEHLSVAAHLAADPSCFGAVH